MARDTLYKDMVLHGKNYDYRIEEVLGQGTFGITYLILSYGR